MRRDCLRANSAQRVQGSHLQLPQKVLHLRLFAAKLGAGVVKSALAN
jgi:hypothetical protein